MHLGPTQVNKDLPKLKAFVNSDINKEFYKPDLLYIAFLRWRIDIEVIKHVQ